jgi:deoxyribodipyrimidine photo-lyase
MNSLKQNVNIFWFRRDLRFSDNHGLLQALQSGLPVLPVFIFDADILARFPPNDARVSFIYDTVLKMKSELENQGSSLLVMHGKVPEVFQKMCLSFHVNTVFVNRDYEPEAIERERKVEEQLKSNGVTIATFKDQVIFEGSEVLKDDGNPYTVFTPYSKKWKQHLNRQMVKLFPSETILNRLVRTAPFPVPGLKEMGIERNVITVPPPVISEEIIRNYAETRDYPAIQGTTRLGIHLRFGTLSIRELVRRAAEWSETFLNELIWRDFFSSILEHFPHVVGQAFKSQYDFIPWRNDEKEFERWCRGETGFPIVDAGMRELNATGFMHNRVRMITAGFLTKHLLIDWRWGEAWFAEKLLDFELASNNGNWQWAAGTGCDAAPYFRIFNPGTQQKKFDPHGEYIRKWVPEAGTPKYTPPVVDHKSARERALNAYKSALK